MVGPGAHACQRRAGDGQFLHRLCVLQPARPRVRAPSRLISPRWGLIRFRSATRTHAPCGARAASQTIPRKAPSHKHYHYICVCVQVRPRRRRQPHRPHQGTRREPFNFTPMAVNPISSGSPHVRCTPMGRTCGEPDEIKKIPTRKILPLFFGSRTATPPGQQTA